jgi:ElaB/YqjD/DUF883 family membrane-anchored ribosome-binding protein
LATKPGDFAMAVEDRIQDTIRGTAAGVAENLYGQKTDVARKSANSFEDALRSMIENEPYKSVLIGLGIGWLLGRMHRPL